MDILESNNCKYCGAAHVKSISEPCQMWVCGSVEFEGETERTQDCKDKRPPSPKNPWLPDKPDTPGKWEVGILGWGHAILEISESGYMSFSVGYYPPYSEDIFKHRRYDEH